MSTIPPLRRIKDFGPHGEVEVSLDYETVSKTNLREKLADSASPLIWKNGLSLFQNWFRERSPSYSHSISSGSDRVPHFLVLHFFSTRRKEGKQDKGKACPEGKEFSLVGCNTPRPEGRQRERGERLLELKSSNTTQL